MKIPEVYFGAADKQMEIFLKHNSFKKHFLYAILFQGNLVIPDIFFYISHEIKNSIVGKGLPVFLPALKRGILLPTFRSESGGSFRVNLKEIQNQEIQGVLPEANEIANVLEKFTETSSRYKYKVWPPTLLSEGFQEIIIRALRSRQFRIKSSIFDYTWEATSRLRNSVIDDAVDKKIGPGLRRGDIYNAAARHFGIKNTRVDDIRTFLKQIENPVDRDNAQRFLKWVNYCYHYNQGKMFGLDTSLVELEEIDITFSDGLRKSKPLQDSVDALCTTLTIPSAEQLLTVDPSKLLEVRESDVGMEYFANLIRWQNDPSEKSAENLLVALSEYAKKITSTYVAYGHNVLRPKNIIRAEIPTSNVDGNFLLDRFMHLIETFVFPIGLIGFVTDTVAGGYGLMPEKAMDFFNWILGIKEIIRMEIKPQKSLLHREKKKNSTADGVFK